jgi:hypothetical protein
VAVLWPYTRNETYSLFLVRGVIAAHLNREPSPGVKGVPPEVFRPGRPLKP